MKLTKNFALEEFQNEMGMWVVDELDEEASLTRYTRMAEALQELRDCLGGPCITITSGFRTAEDQLRINPTTLHSYHSQALGCDFVVAGYTPREVFLLLTRTWPGGLGMYITHTHIDLRHIVFKPRARWVDNYSKADLT